MIKDAIDKVRSWPRFAGFTFVLFVVYNITLVLSMFMLSPLYLFNFISITDAFYYSFGLGFSCGVIQAILFISEKINKEENIDG